MMPRSHRPPILCLLLGLAACSSSGGSGGSGGASASGGASQTGGQAGSGGAGSNGGVTGTGGRSSQSGGTPGSGGNGAGGGVATGGTKASTGTGGSVGGSTSSTGGGGGSAAGGSTGTGTTPASTGGQAGGTTGTGTTASTGGATGTGGQTCPALPTAAVASKDIIEFNDNGGWCWYQDERAVVDAKGGKFVIGSVASGGSRDSDQEVVIYDIASGSKKRYTLQSDLNVDDHNAPAFVVNADATLGAYAAIWATHRDNCYSYYSTFSGTSWTASKKYDWSADGCPWDTASNPSPAHMVTYANPWFLSAENKILSPTRSVSTSPASLQSTDGGNSWKFYGRLTSTKTVGYVAGYYKYWGNGVDRIDFVGTEAHPRDADNSLYHGYYKGGKLYNSSDKVIDDNAGDTSAQDVTAFTKVFATGSSVGSTKLCRMWNHDIVRYDDGTVAILGQGRADNCTSTPSGSDPDKRMVYFRWDGKAWKSTYLVKTGPKLYADEEDYTGLSAVHPDNPNVIFVSTAIDPRDDKTVLSKREIFMGVTCDNGTTFKWAPITEKSSVDNIRPIVPKWDSSHTLLLWMNGTYRKAQDYTMKIVGTTVLLPPAAH